MGTGARTHLLVACEIFDREIRLVAKFAPCTLELVFLEQGLHDRGADLMRAALQEAVDRADPARHDAVLLGYGMCGRGLVGLAAPRVPLVVPRAHDCISILLGGRARHEAALHDHAGTYWRSCGWIEKTAGRDGLANPLAFGGMNASPYDMAALIEKFGEEDAREIVATLNSHMDSYDRVAFIETGAEPDGSLEASARAEARQLGWEYLTVPGDLGWLKRLAAGPWGDDEFLTLAPGTRIAAAYDGTVIRAEAATSPG